MTNAVQPKARPAFCFAAKYSNEEILNDASKAKAFEDEFIKGEAKYTDVVHDKRTGLIYDGFNLDKSTGQIEGTRNWSAPSKECLDLGIIVKALEGDSKAADLLGGGDKVAAKAKAVELCTQKLAAYKEFQAQNPGYAGFMPWYGIESDKTVCKPDWVGKIPGLDNGEWMWSMLVTEKALRDGGNTALAGQYKEYNQMLMDNVTKVFYDPEGHACRGDVKIINPEDPNTGYEALNKGSYMTGQHGVHEGTMLIHYLTLFGKDLPEGAADRIFGDIHMKRNDANPHGSTWEAFWGSPHESWAYMFLPFRDDSHYKDLFRIREVIRADNAVDHDYPGFGVSANGPNGEYLSAAGIEGIGTQPVTANNTYGVYGAFPMLLEFSQKAGPGNFGLTWLHNMLLGPRMQGPLGAGELVQNDGKAFAAVKTTDGTAPTLLALMGGLEKDTADVMKEKGVYEKFMSRIDKAYKENFSAAPLREPDGFEAPTVTVPLEFLGDYNVV